MAEETKREHDQRVGAPKREQSSREVTSGREDAPVGKGQYITDSSTPSRPQRAGRGAAASSTSSRPANSGRRPRPTSIQTRPAPTNPVLDKTDVETYYELQVVDSGSQYESVANLVMGEDWRKRSLNPHGGFGTIASSANADSLLTLAGKLIGMGAKVNVTKQIRATYSFQGLDKGGEVTEKGHVKNSYTLIVVDYKKDLDAVLDIILGTERNRNLQVEFPVMLNYNDDQAEEVFALAQKLLDAGAKIELTNKATLYIPLT